MPRRLRGRLGRPPAGKGWRCIGYASRVERGARWLIWWRCLPPCADIKIHADGRVDGKANYHVAFDGTRLCGRKRIAQRLAVDLPHAYADALAVARCLYTAGAGGL